MATTDNDVEFVRRLENLICYEDVFGYDRERVSQDKSDGHGDALRLGPLRLHVKLDGGDVVVEARMATYRDAPDFDVWGEDAEFPRRDWQYQVANGDTNEGYWDWVDHEREVRADEDENRGKRAADVEAAVTTAAREAAWLEMGYSVTDDRIETALQICYGYSDDELTTGLAELTAQLAAAGGRGVALAEAIDNRRIALAVRRANAKERQ
jgi:hypothetical protein